MYVLIFICILKKKFGNTTCTKLFIISLQYFKSLVDKIDWNEYTPAKLKTPISKELSNTTPAHRNTEDTGHTEDTQVNSCDELNCTILNYNIYKL